MPTVQEAFADPRFRALPATDQQILLGRLEPKYAQLPANEQLTLLQQGLQYFAPPSVWGMAGSLDKLADAISRHEAGDRAARNNNPGNLKFAGQPGATQEPNGPFAVFPTAQAGRSALLAQLQADQQRMPNATPEEYFAKYSPDSDPGNGPGQSQAYANSVRQSLTAPSAAPPAQPVAAPSTLPAPGGPMPDLSRYAHLAQVIAPVGRQPGDAAYGSDQWYMEKLGKLVPQAAIPGLVTADKVAVQPLERAAKEGGKLGGMAALDVMGFTNPAHPFQSADTFAKENPVTAGITQAVGQLVGSTAADPRNWPFFASNTARTVLQKAISTGFAAQMSAGTLQAAHQLLHDWDNLSPQQRAEGVTSAGLSGIFAGMAGLHAGSAHEPAPAELPAPFTSPVGQTVRERLRLTVQPDTPTTAATIASRDSSGSPDSVTRETGATPVREITSQSKNSLAINTTHPVEPSATVESPAPQILAKGPTEPMGAVGVPGRESAQGASSTDVTPPIRERIVQTLTGIAADNTTQSTQPQPSVLKAPPADTTFKDIGDAVSYGQKTYGAGNYRIDANANGEQVVTPKGRAADLDKLQAQIQDYRERADVYLTKRDQLARNPEKNAENLAVATREHQLAENAGLDKTRQWAQQAPPNVVDAAFDKQRQRVLSAAESVAQMQDLAKHFEISSKIVDKLRTDPDLSYEQKVGLNRLLGRTEEHEVFKPLRYIPKGPPGSKGERLGLAIQDKVSKAREEIRGLLAEPEALSTAQRARLQSYLDKDLPVTKNKYWTRPAKSGESFVLSDNGIFKPATLASMREAFGNIRTKMGTLRPEDQAKLTDYRKQLAQLRDDHDTEGYMALHADMTEFRNRKMVEFLDQQAQMRQAKLEREQAWANALGIRSRRTVNADIQAVFDKHLQPWEDLRKKYFQAPGEAAAEPQRPARAALSATDPADLKVEAAVARSAKAEAATTRTPEQEAQFKKNEQFITDKLPQFHEAVETLRDQISKEPNAQKQQRLAVQLEDALAKQHMAMRKAAKIADAPYDDQKLTVYEKAESRILASEVTSEADKQRQLQKLRNDFPNEAIAAAKADSHQKTLAAIKTAWSEPSGKGLASPKFPRRSPGVAGPEAGYASLPMFTDPIKAIGDAWQTARAFTDPAKQLSVNDVAKGTLREMSGEMIRDQAVLAREMEPYINELDKRSAGESIDFINRMERGLPQQNPADQAIANSLRGLLDERRDAIAGLDIGIFEAASPQKIGAYLRKIVAETDPNEKAKMVMKMTTVARGYIENYFPHIWDKASVFERQAPQMMHDLEVRLGQDLKTRPLQGSADFLKTREHELFMDGISRGLVPVIYNPVKLAMIRIGEMDRFIKAWQIYKDYDMRGLATDDQAKAAALGYGSNKLDRRIFNKDVWAHPRVQTVLQNHLAPGLWNSQISFENPLASGHQIEIPWYRLMRNGSNLLNLAQLGLSAFHFTGTSINMMVSDLALAGQRAYHLEFDKAFTPAVKAVLAPLSPISGFLRGGKLMEEYLSPGTHADLEKYAEAIEIAGGRPVMDPGMRAMQKEAFSRNLKAAMNDALPAMTRAGTAAKLPFNTFGKVLEAMSGPLMDKYVPRLKLAAFMDQAQYVFDRLGPDADREVLRKELGKAYDSIDNRFGQLNYNNLNWNRTLRDMSQIVMRAPGWSIGTVKELGGGTLDLAKSALSVATLRKTEISSRTAYTAALFLQVGYLSAAYMYMHTGQFPKTLTDFVYPKNGQKNAEGEDQRSNIVSYLREVFSAEHDWKQWAVNKLNPTIQLGEELWKNRDFFNIEIAHPDDPKAKQFGQIMMHILSAFVPFSGRNAMEAHRLGATPLQTGERFFGINPAPAWAGRSPMEQRLADMAGVGHAAVAGRTEQAFDQARNVGALRAQMMQGKANTDTLRQAVQAGKISQNDSIKLMEQFAERQTFVQRNFKSINAAQALQLWNLASPQERKQILPLMREKRSNISFTLPKPDADTLLQRYAQAGIK